MENALPQFWCFIQTITPRPQRRILLVNIYPGHMATWETAGGGKMHSTDKNLTPLLKLYKSTSWQYRDEKI